MGHGRGSEGPGEGPGPAGWCRPRALPAVTLTTGPCTWRPAWLAGRAREPHPLQARRGPGGSRVPRRTTFVGDERSAETWRPDSARSPHPRPQAAWASLPSMPGLPAAWLLAGWVHVWWVCVNHPRPSHPGWALRVAGQSAVCLNCPHQGHQDSCWAIPLPQVWTCFIRTLPQGGLTGRPRPSIGALHSGPACSSRVPSGPRPGGQDQPQAHSLRAQAPHGWRSQSLSAASVDPAVCP